MIQKEPWLTEEAIDFLDSYLTRDMHILEYGSGSSTLWLQNRCEYLVSIEHNDRWYRKVMEEMLALKHWCSWSYVQGDTSENYAIQSILSDACFDLILVDGIRRNECIKFAYSLLRSGGVLMLDNVEVEAWREGVDFLDSLGWERHSSIQKTPHRTWSFHQVPRNRFDWQTDWWIKGSV